MRNSAALLLPLLLAACAHETPYATTIGTLAPGSTMTVRLARGTLNAYHPAAGEPSSRFTVAATARKGASPPPPVLRTAAGGLSVSAQSLAELLVRVPDGVNLVVDARDGDVRVTDITGNVRIVVGRGSVLAMLPGYAQAHAGSGNVSVRMGSTDWPGTLRFSTGRGDVDVWIRDASAFHAHLHTVNGTIFTDFNLRGTSEGTSETIDGDVNGGGSHGVDIETLGGEIRLLQLHPQP
ncbi:MAG TPA: DUF4097 family beta strand repeat-containing protein [Candidatus Tumulicola sp.]|jgi:hypothetical protein